MRGGLGLGDVLGCLFLGQPEQLLDPRAKTGQGGLLDLLHLPVSVGELPLQGLSGFLVPARLVLQLLQALIDLVRVIPSHDTGEVGRVIKIVAELSIDVGLHVA